MSSPAHVPVRRVLEQITAMPGIQPLRIFALLLPMWAVRVKSVVREAQPYEVFDRYLSRAIGPAGLRDGAALAAFFGVEPPLVERALRFLETIGHVRRDAEMLSLTDIGRISVADDQRYVLKEDQQVLYFDGFTGAPMPKAYYSGEWLDEPELSLAGMRFQPVSGDGTFRAGAVAELERRPDREKFNLPGALNSVKLIDVSNAWLPAYVVECVSGLLAYAKAVEGTDLYLAKLVTPYLRDALAAEERVDDVRIWREWLAGRGFRDVDPRRRPNGVLRASLPPAAFGRDLQWWQLGSFETRKGSFLQLWCDDAAARRQAVLTRAGAVLARRGIRDRDGVDRRLAGLAMQLNVPAPTVEDLEQYARKAGDESLMAELEKIIAASPPGSPE